MLVVSLQKKYLILTSSHTKIKQRLVRNSQSCLKLGKHYGQEKENINQEPFFSIVFMKYLSFVSAFFADMKNERTQKLVTI